jgi:hypothetical protein
MSSNHPSLKETNEKLLKEVEEVEEVSGICGLLKPAAHPEPAKNKSGLQSVYWLLCKALIPSVGTESGKGCASGNRRIPPYFLPRREHS